MSFGTASKPTAAEQAKSFTSYNQGLCDNAPPPSADCTMTDRRKEMISRFQGRALAAQGSFRDAVGDVRVDSLLSKGDEGSWLTMLLIDVAFGHITRVASIGAKAFVRSVNSSAAPEAVAAHMKAPGKAGQKATENAFKKDPAHKTKQGESQPWLMSMVASADASFEAFREGACNNLDDAGIMKLIDGMEAKKHTRDMYAAQITAQLARYHSSGVPKIGRSNVKDASPEEAWDVDSAHGHVSRDTRVVWYTNRIAGTRELVYEHADGGYRGIHPEGKIALEGSLTSAYEDNSYGADAKRQRFGAPVPSEFQAAAIAKHQAAWKEPPPEVELDLTGQTTRKPGAAAQTVDQDMHDIFVGRE